VTVIVAAKAAAGMRLPTARTAASFKNLIGILLGKVNFWKMAWDREKRVHPVHVDNHPHVNRCSKI
jgi:hypothetical protein